MKVVIASDHAGFDLKEWLKKNKTDVEWVDVGTHDSSSVDYPDFADLAVREVQKRKSVGVMICGSGQGICMRANKYPDIRAALCWDTVTARASREHNDANVLCLGARLLPFGLALEIVAVWLATPFAGGRHEARVKKINNPI